MTGDDTTAAVTGTMPVTGPLERGLTVIRAMTASGSRRLRPSDLVHATGLARATVDRVVGTLLHLGLLRTTGRDIELSPRLMRFGNAYLASCGVADALQPFAELIADELDESVSVAVPDGDGVRFVAQVIRRRAMTPVFRIGDLLPADRCAAGMVTGPESPEWAVDDQRMEQGLIAVAVPVRDAEGRPACGISVVSNTGRHTAASLTATALPRLRALLPAMEAALSEARDRPPRPGAGTAPDTPLPDAKRELGAGFLQSLARGLDVLAALGAGPRGLTLSETAEAVGQPRATARRALLSLEHLGYVHSADRRFRLLPRVLELGYAPLSGLSFTEVVQPHLEDLAARVRESASVAVLDGQDIRYIARVPAYRIMSVNITIGTRFPATPTSMGRILLAGLPPEERAARLSAGTPPRFTGRTVTDPAELGRILDRVASEGYALVDEELEEGLRSLAVPVRGRDGRPVAALNVSTHTGRGTAEESRAALLPALRETAARISEDLATAFERRPLRLP
ncbi:IclR family transcriptional regulator domain-containing protein [Streptomyces xinghaiensis]|uniref:IclR family transcriptional regulator domain-containing protein n=1 Tax=Streptomyces xinghaiensis TaxID=1038928 RepID=UPI001EDECDD6|nr:IclR family transcriptional regulator C-terminal domain-containing protein [Streptomyces xinghaiensis]